ncbi:hypothetical protein FD754_001959 [Muntiacus muntjak]|uniref:EGF-like domain-containing protein n=1 Tax=Muntiacus muntjak TaxID=9888 RepID=A0A5N3W8M1_MUNMU|nr:hypothetical protein FD754_001959 [Muntiacus muntjak]
MVLCGLGSPLSLVPWAAALLFVLSVARALALPEVLKQIKGWFFPRMSPPAVLQACGVLMVLDSVRWLDLQNCSLKDAGPNFPQAHTAIIIDLQANPLQGDLVNTFRGFTQLQTLILPQDVNCPGGINAWDTVTFYVNNQSCEGQRNICNSTEDPEICPENGSCVPDGPGLLQCVCADGFHGYKCMRQGSFPLFMFFGILGSTTLSISILLWGTQRRKAKAS